MLFDDHFLYSHDLPVCSSNDTVREIACLSLSGLKFKGLRKRELEAKDGYGMYDICCLSPSLNYVQSRSKKETVENGP